MRLTKIFVALNSGSPSGPRLRKCYLSTVKSFLEALKTISTLTSLFRSCPEIG